MDATGTGRYSHVVCWEISRLSRRADGDEGPDVKRLEKQCEYDKRMRAILVEEGEEVGYLAVEDGEYTYEYTGRFPGLTGQFERFASLETYTGGGGGETDDGSTLTSDDVPAEASPREKFEHAAVAAQRTGLFVTVTDE